VDRRWAVALVGAFAVTRALAFVAGVRFDVEPLRYFYQFLDPELLQEQLLGSVAHLHAQPPLFNLFLGTGLKTGAAAGPLFHATFLLLGLVTVLAIFRTIVALGASPHVAGAVSLLYLAHPAAILYENHLFYPQPITAGLAVSALLLRRYVADGAWRHGVPLFLILGALALLRPLFHLIWLAAVAGLVATAVRPRRTAACAALPVLLVTAWYARTLVLFGTFGASTLLGLSVTKITTFQGPLSERAALIADGTLSGLAVVPPFRRYEFYEKQVPPPPPTGVAALDRRMKSTGFPNFNYAGYPAVSRIYLDDAKSVLRVRPDWYLRGLVGSFRNSFRSPWGGQFLEENAAHLRPLTAVYGIAHRARDAGAIALTLGVLAAACVRLLRAARRGSLRSPDAVTIAYLVGVALWVTLVGNLLEIGENYRYRWGCFPALFVLFGVLLPARGSGIRDRSPLP
jgi:hypothetical protein